MVTFRVVNCYRLFWGACCLRRHFRGF